LLALSTLQGARHDPRYQHLCQCPYFMLRISEQESSIPVMSASE